MNRFVHAAIRSVVPPLLRSKVRQRRRQKRIAQAARYWDQAHRAPTDDVAFWLSVPEVRAAVNERTTGERDVDYVDQFLRVLREKVHLPLERVLSVGCGAGELECRLVEAGAAARLLGIDVSGASLDSARSRSEARGLSDRTEFLEVEAGEWFRAVPGVQLDLIIFHGVLHHIEAIEEVLDEAARALDRGSPGLALVCEYVGPSRHEWMDPWHGCSDAELGYARSLFARTPVECRRTPGVWPPLDVGDPTEMIRSREIDTLLRERFQVLYYWPMYGNVVVPLINALKASCLDRPEVAAVIQEAMALEDYLIERQLLQPLHACYVARPKGNG